MHAAGQSLSKIAVQFAASKATIHAVVAVARTAGQAPAPATPAKPTTAARKLAASGADEKADMESLRDQLRLYPWHC